MTPSIRHSRAGLSCGYWWHDDGWEQVSTVRDGRVDLHLDSGLLAQPARPEAPESPDDA